MNHYLTEADKSAPRLPRAMDRWLRERCVTEPNAKALTSELFADWEQWAVSNDEFCGSMRLFSNALIDRRIERWRNNFGLRGFKGLGLKEIVRAPSPSDHTTITEAQRCA